MDIGIMPVFLGQREAVDIYDRLDCNIPVYLIYREGGKRNIEISFKNF